MTESEIKQWLNLGMDIGAHTRTHADLTSISEKKAYGEINDCKTDLENKFNVKVADFCYPFGRFNDLILKMVENSNYSTASTMQRGRVNLASNNYLLPRIPINYRTLPHLFLAKILTNYEDKR